MDFCGKLFISGEYVSGKNGKYFKTLNPATEEDICEVSIAELDDINDAVTSSENAQIEWMGLDASQRGLVLFEIAKAIEEHGDELARIDCTDSGRPILDCQEDIHAAANMFYYYGGLTDKIYGETIPVQNDKMCFTKREPYGVIVGITAWNYPLFNASAKIAPIIATGNSCIIKPAEEAPLSALKLAEIIQSVTNVPNGLVNILNGPGEITGQLLARHEKINKISFTGSTATGRSIMNYSADSNLKSVVLELGGKSPFLIFSDANIEMAVRAIFFSVFFNQGQTCTAGTRLIVDEKIKESVVKQLENKIKSLKMGNPEDEETNIGPLVSREQYEKVSSYISKAISGGYNPIIGGNIGNEHKKGYFIEPTVFIDIPEDHFLATDEIFGPVLVIQSFKSQEQAIKIANNSKYGLAASVWTKSNKKLIDLSDQLKAGIVWCNTVFSEHPGAPAGGYKLSGIGREYGKSAIEEYTQLKTVWIDKSNEFFEWP